ncbi:MAG: hypothetical protein CMC61_05010 [Flavobacteriaceae bacterium]|nr:hypothetical protein [Flavobacteriaceae bacterium]
MNILTRIALTIFLLLMAAVYLPIGLWAIIAPAQDALGLELPSFYEAVGLSVISPIGYSEFAGIYGGINIVIGLMFLIGIFKEHVGLFSIKVLVFLVGSIALGRFLLMMLGSQAGLPIEINTFLIFEVIVFSIGIIFIRALKDIN